MNLTWSIRKAYGKLAGWQSERDWRNGPETYMGMVEVSRALMKACTCLDFKTVALCRPIG